MTEYLFIHIPKNGGFALSKSDQLKSKLFYIDARAMHSKEYVLAVKQKMDSLKLNYQFGHCRWRDLHPDIQFKYIGKTVAVVRNPWSRTVSQYTFAKQIMEENPMNINPTSLRLNASFEEFLQLRHIWGKTPYFWHRTTVGWYPQSDYVTDVEGDLRADILSFENYEEDTNKYFGLNQKIPERNVSNKSKKDYKDFYTKQTIQIIADWYKKDIDYFGFDFDTGATRNLYYETHST